jgi:uncharacterized protein YjbI with pentapeptide repeats
MLLMLGEYGAGKTTTVKHLAKLFAENHLNNNRETRIPIFLELRNFGHNFNLRSFLNDYLITQNELVRSFALFRELIKEGRFLLIFDGFDEMAILADLNLVLRNFEDILSLATNKSKIIVTCRTGFFKDSDHLNRLQQGMQLSDIIDNKRTTKTVFLEEFSEDQIHEYLSRFYGQTWTEYLTAMEKTSAVNVLANKPITLNMIVKTHKNPQSFRSLNIAELYELYTNIWLKRDDWRCTLTNDQRARISQILAFEFVSKNKTNIHYREIEVMLSQHFGHDIDQGMIEQYGHEVRTCSFLKNDLQGFYTFTHLSFAEYLAAKHMQAELVKENNDILSVQVSKETLDFLGQIIAEDARDYIPYLSDYFKKSANCNSRARAVAAYLLYRCGSTLANLDLSGANFPDNISFNKAHFPNAKMIDVKGHQIDFESTDMSEGKLMKSSLVGCNFAQAILKKANFTEAILKKCNFTGTNLEGATFVKADLKDVVLDPNDIVDNLNATHAAEINARLKELRLVQNDESMLLELFRNNNAKKQFATRLWKHEYKEDFNSILEDSKKMIVNITESFAIEEAKKQKRITECRGKIEVLENIGRISYTRKSRIDDRKKEISSIRKYLRYLRLRQEIIKSKLITIVSAVEKYLMNRKITRSNVESMMPNVKGTIFANSKGLTAVQARWAASQGAIIRLEEKSM